MVADKRTVDGNSAREKPTMPIYRKLSREVCVGININVISSTSVITDRSTEDGT